LLQVRAGSRSNLGSFFDSLIFETMNFLLRKNHPIQIRTRNLPHSKTNGGLILTFIDKKSLAPEQLPCLKQMASLP